MPYFTTIGKSVYCPYLKMEVSLTGKYQMLGDANKVKLSCVSCSVIENSRRPIWEQDESEKYIICPRNGSCELLKDFNNGVDFKKHGLSL